MHYTLYIIHYTLYIIHYTLYIIHYTLYIIQYTLYIIHFTTDYYYFTQNKIIRLLQTLLSSCEQLAEETLTKLFSSVHNMHAYKV